MNDGGDGVEEGQGIRARDRPDRPREAVRGQRPGRHDPVARVGQVRYFARDDLDQRFGLQGLGHGRRESVAIDCQGAARRQLVAVGSGHDQPAGRPHFPMQLAHGVHHVIVGPEAVGTNHFRAIAGLVGEGALGRTHLVQDDGDTCAGDLPGGLGPGQACADDVDWFHDNLLRRG